MSRKTLLINGSEIEITDLEYPSCLTDRKAVAEYCKGLKRECPKVIGHKDSYLCKNFIQQKVQGDIHHREDKVNNVSAIGLYAARRPWIYSALSPYITGRMVNVNNNKDDYRKLRAFQKLEKLAYPENLGNPQFITICDDINSVLFNTKRSDQYGSIDLDFCNNFSRAFVKRMIAGLSVAAADKCVLSIWQCSGRHVTDYSVDNIIRPMMIREIEEWSRIIRYTQIDYAEPTPMRVDIYTIECRSA